MSHKQFILNKDDLITAIGQFLYDTERITDNDLNDEEGYLYYEILNENEIRVTITNTKELN